MLRAQLPTLDHDEQVVVGPASALSELIAVAARNSVDDLSELIREPLMTGGEREARLRAAVAAAIAWLVHGVRGARVVHVRPAVRPR